MTLTRAQQQQYLYEAYFEAGKSPDLSNQNGAVLICDSADTPETFVVRGCNCFPDGVEVTDDRLTKRPDKYRYIEHAERSVILEAAYSNYPTNGSTLVCPWAACCDCARAIIGAGVETVVVHKQRMALTPERWQEDVDAAMAMLTEAGIEIVEYDGSIDDGGSILVNGRLWDAWRCEFEDESDEGDTSNISMNGEVSAA